MAVPPPARFGALELDGTTVLGFREKLAGDSQFIDGGFFVLDVKVLDLIDGDSTTWEREPLERLAVTGELQAYSHEGFWQPMDTPVALQRTVAWDKQFLAGHDARGLMLADLEWFKDTLA